MRSIRKGNKRYLRSTQKKERNGTLARDSNEDANCNGRETSVEAKQANGSNSLMNFDVKRYVIVTLSRLYVALWQYNASVRFTMSTQRNVMISLLYSGRAESSSTESIKSSQDDLTISTNFPMAKIQNDNNQNKGGQHQNQTFGDNLNDSLDLELANQQQSKDMTTSASLPLLHSGADTMTAIGKNRNDPRDSGDNNSQNSTANDENGNLNEDTDKSNSDTQDRWHRLAGFSLALGAVTVVAKIIAEDDDDDIAGNLDGSNFQGNSSPSQPISQPPASQPPSAQPNR